METDVLDGVAIPTDSAELNEFMNDEKRMKLIGSNPAALGELIKNYANAFNKKNTNFEAMVREEAQRAMAEFYKDAGGEGKPPVDFAPKAANGRQQKRIEVRNRGEILMADRPYNKRAPGVAFNQAYTEGDLDIADLMQMVYHKQSNRDILDRRAQWSGIQNSAGSVIPADGGFLIPELLRDELLQLALESAVVRPRAKVLPMSSLRVPIPAVDETTHVGSIFGGLTAYWTSEGAALTPSQAEFARVVLEAKKLTIYADVPNELIDDAPLFSAFIGRAFPQAIAYFEDVKFFTGNGAGEPLGWLNSAATIKVDPATSSKVAWGDVTSMFTSLLPESQGSAVWLASPDVYNQLLQMTFSSNGFPVLFPAGGGGQGAPMTLLGRPVINTEKSPALGTDGGLSVVDFSYYLIGDRQAMTAAQSVDYKFANDMTSFRVIERVDGRPWLLSALTPENGSANQLSAFVQLSGTHT